MDIDIFVFSETHIKPDLPDACVNILGKVSVFLIIGAYYYLIMRTNPYPDPHIYAGKLHDK